MPTQQHANGRNTYNLLNDRHLEIISNRCELKQKRHLFAGYAVKQFYVTYKMADECNLRKDSSGISLKGALSNEITFDPC
jgi:hypothetical protein